MKCQNNKCKSCNTNNRFDKIILKFLCDVLYLKEIIGAREYDDILDSASAEDLDEVFEKMMMEEYSYQKRGEVEWEMLNGQIVEI